MNVEQVGTVCADAMSWPAAVVWVVFIIMAGLVIGKVLDWLNS